MVDRFCVLGIDTALTRSGWAVAEWNHGQETILSYGTIGTGKAGNTNVTRAVTLRRDMEDLINRFHPDVVYLETHEELGGKRNRSHAVAGALGMARNAIEEPLEALGVPFRRIAPSKWRECFCGSRRARKETAWIILDHLGALPTDHPVSQWLNKVVSGHSDIEDAAKEAKKLKESAASDEADAMAIALTGVRLHWIEVMSTDDAQSKGQTAPSSGRQPRTRPG